MHIFEAAFELAHLTAETGQGNSDSDGLGLGTALSMGEMIEFLLVQPIYPQMKFSFECLHICEEVRYHSVSQCVTTAYHNVLSQVPQRITMCYHRYHNVFTLQLDVQVI